MSKIITSNQLLGELGEAAVRSKFLSMGFQFDGRSRLESGIDGIAEVMIDGQPLARMIAVQVKATESSKYSAEDDSGFFYLLRSDDVNYWRTSNLPIILVLYRRSDETFFWKDITGTQQEGRRVRFDKQADVLDKNAVDRLAALTVPKAGFGYYIPPLGGGEEALVNMLPITLPEEIFVASTPYSAKQASAILLKSGVGGARFDWVIKDGSFWSFHDPCESICREIVDADQVEAIETNHLAFHEDLDERNHFAYLLKQTFSYQYRNDLAWNKDRKLFYFKANLENQSRKFQYESAQKRTESDVVNVIKNKADPDRVDFVRHHAFIPRFESLYDQWFLVINPTYFFTYNGFSPHRNPHALLSGKKRLDKSASLRGQVIMWHRFLTKAKGDSGDLFSEVDKQPSLSFSNPPTITLSTRVPEDVWNSQKKSSDCEDEQEILNFGS